MPLHFTTRLWQDWRTFDCEVGVKIVGSFSPPAFCRWCCCWTPAHSETHFTVSLTAFPCRKYSSTCSFTLQSLRREIEAQIGQEWSSYFFCLLWRDREREVIKMTISCSRSERGRKNICFLFRASNNPTGNSFLLYATVINSTVYYMQWLAVGPQMTQVMSVEM